MYDNYGTWKYLMLYVVAQFIMYKAGQEFNVVPFGKWCSFSDATVKKYSSKI